METGPTENLLQGGIPACYPCVSREERFLLPPLPVTLLTHSLFIYTAIDTGSALYSDENRKVMLVSADSTEKPDYPFTKLAGIEMIVSSSLLIVAVNLPCGILYKQTTWKLTLKAKTDVKIQMQSA